MRTIRRPSPRIQRRACSTVGITALAIWVWAAAATLVPAATLYMLHLVSAMPNAGPHIEFKGYTDLPIECNTSSLHVEDGKIKVPTGPGIGVDIDPDYVKKHNVVENV